MEKFTISGGCHYSTKYLKPYLFKDKIEFAFKFSNNCGYFFGNENDLILNTIFGISFGHQHKNSIRLGWKWSVQEQCIEIYPYAYINGKYIQELNKCLSKIKPNELTYCTIEINSNNFNISIVTLNSANSTKITKPKLIKIGYYLFPYFGGKLPAPHDMDIYLMHII